MKTRNALIVCAVLGAAGCAAAVLAWRASSQRRGEIVIVSALAEGSSSSMNEAQLAMPIEHALMGVRGLKRLRTESRPNEVRASCFFAPGIDVDAATQDVQAALRNVGPQLPASTLAPMAMRGSSEDPPLWAIGDAHVRELLQTVPGVAQVEACGETAEWVRVNIDPARLAAVALDLGAVLRELSASPLGRALPDVEALSGTVLTATHAPVPVRLSDIATVRVERRGTGCEANMLGEGETLARITLQRGANRKDVAKVIAGKVHSSGGRWLDPARTIVLALGFEHGAASGLTTRVATDLAGVSGVSHVVAARHDAHDDDVELVVTVDPAGGKQTLAALRTRAITSRPGVVWRGVRASPWGNPSVLTVTLKGPELEGLEERAREVRKRVAGVAGVGPEIGVALGSVPFLNVEIDREQASRAGVRASDIAEVIRAATTGVFVGSHVRVFVGDGTDEARFAPLAPQLLVGRTPLSSLVRVSAQAQPPVILRIDGQRAIELQWELDSSFSKRTAKDALADMNTSFEVSSR